jgi:pyrimidine operon attenuation protein/uracil phosphoribosyltransferase
MGRRIVSRPARGFVTQLYDAQGMARLVDGLADQIAAGRRPDVPLRLVGIRTRGVPLAERLAARLRAAHGVEAPVGAVDITLYRDDLGRAARWPVLLGTDIGFPVEGAEIVLVDDVLFTGRSARAALNTVCDLGRPAAVRLAVVADRGGRELPIRPDYTGVRCEAGPRDRILVRLTPIDPADEIVRATLADG